MSDPTRLRDSAGSPFESTLLRSWTAEGPSDEAKARAIALAAALPSSIDRGAPRRPDGRSAPPTRPLPMAKWALFGGAGLATVGALYFTLSAGIPRRTSLNVSREPALSLAPAEEPVVRPAPESVVAASAPTSDVRVAPAAVPRRPLPSGGSNSSLAEEISLIDSARAAYRASDFALTESRLNAYRVRFPRGVLVEEAEVVRIETLVARGDVSLARTLVERFGAAFPASPHRPQLDRLVSSNPR